MSGGDGWALWVMGIRRVLSPYRRTVAGVSLAVMLILILGSIRTELWEPISPDPKKLHGLAVLVALLMYVFILPTGGESPERSDQTEVPRDEK